MLARRPTQPKNRWQAKPFASTCALLTTLLFSHLSFAADGRADYDLDDDGLIEINDLADLNEIRNNLDGKTLYGSNAGCPDADDGTVNGGCIGFELTTDLDFDTNQNGMMGANDTYWSNGEGWNPIGQNSTNNRFAATFEGNGRVIRHLYINRPGARGLGLFGYIENAQIQNIGVTGKLGKLAGGAPIGAIAGYATDSSIQNVFNTLSIYSTGQYKGGIVGGLTKSTIINAFNTGSVITAGTSNSFDYAGGIAGYIHDSSINNTFSSGFVFGRLATGGNIGSNQNGKSSILNSYWAVDSSNQANNYNTSEEDSFFGLALAKLQCATQANSTSSNSDCVWEDALAEGLEGPVTLFKEWDQAMQNGQYLWDFGDVSQLPALVLNGMVYRDSDGDGSLDSDDAWPYERAASIDADNDGHPDIWTMGCNADCIANSGLTLDKFPSNDAAWQDDDFDGLPDTWAEGCDTACQSASNLILDTSLNDTDNDGLTNLNDNDDNNDGITDVDADSDGLIEIHSLAQLDAVRHQLDGSGLRLNAGAELDQSGCPVTLYQGQMVSRCIGYELTKDLDFDTNHDGVMDRNDAYWNEGSGWQPIGGGFKAILDGNGFAIENLYIDRATSRQVGLFSYIEYAVLKNMVLTGPLMSIKGLENVGGLAGSSYLSQINKVINTGSIHGSKSDVGGLIGKTQLDQINSVMNTGSVQGDRYTGGLIGRLNSSQISNAINTGSVQSKNNSGGLVGISSESHINNAISVGYVTNTASEGGLTDGSYSSVITNSYWATDSSTQATSHSQSEASSYTGLTLATLQCATQANTNFTNSNCVSADGSAEGLDGPVTLFNSWDQAMQDGEPLWDFGNAIQLPALVLNGKIYRDSDGDGVLDDDDAWPNERFASLDADADGYPEKWAIDCDETCIANTGLNLDQFPSNKAVWQDDDFDGLPDSWAASCDTTCQEGSGLVLDVNLNDSDNDGLTNLEDTDDNNDGITDADADSDGLIDINSLELLNTMRYQLDGTGLRITSDSELNQTGCPAILYQGKFAPRCIGYELTTDLDFDTNQDGRMDSSDTYWDSGKGWQPVGSNLFQFSAVFEGNGHTIYNLYINRTQYWGNYAGLFGHTKYAILQNVVLTGPLMSVIGHDYVGGLAGLADSSQINNVMNTGPVQGNNKIGGLVGQADSGQISNAMSTGTVQGEYYVGGLVGFPIRGSINNAISTGYTLGGSSVGGLVGIIVGNAQTIQTNSYWAVDSSNQSRGAGQSEANSYVGLTLATLQCATQANTNSSNSSCLSVDGVAEGLNNPVTLFNDWDQATQDGEALWDFGNTTQLPALVLNGKTYRDSDGDGVLDINDTWPNDRFAGHDADGDGYPENWTIGCDDTCISNSGLSLDQFPSHSAAWQDADFDGLPDSWAENCDTTCQANSGLVLDTSLNDTDNDGINNLIDTDDNGDGVTDIDADSDGLIDIHSLQLLNAMRYQLDGIGLRISSNAKLNQSGCPAILYQGKVAPRCIGYELTTDLDFDTNQDGIMDSSDTYWNRGYGWHSIGYRSKRFHTLFEGNGYSISNLYINRATSYYVGLFGYTDRASIQNLALTGPLMSVTGGEQVGGLIGKSDSSRISNVISTGTVQGNAYTGGLIGGSYDSDISNVMNTGFVQGERYTGGIVGYNSSESITNAISSGKVAGVSYTGGLVGYRGTNINNSYWAKDGSGQRWSPGQTEASSYVGVTLQTLQCAIDANTNSTNSDCVSSDGSTEGLSNPINLFNEWDQATLNGQRLWNFGSDTQLPALVLNGKVYRDSDGDGLLDEDDNLPFDTDNDGIVNQQDIYPFIALGNLTDIDNDGAPDTCDVDCLALGMNADTDNDNDGVSDVDDKFPLDPSEHSDFDGDGIGDAADLDDDNDGVNDVDDPNLGEDNGKPEIINVPSIDPIAVTTENGDAFELLVDDNFLNAFTTVDVVDTEFTYEASLNGDVLAIDENDIMLIPAGRQAVQVVAIDASGNRSEPVEMVAIVYPQVRFEQATSIIGENSTTNIKVSLTGDAPDYPVVVNFAINELSDVNQADLDAGFDIQALHQVIIEASDTEVANRDGFIKIGIIDDNESENDELLIVDLLSAKLESETDDEIESLFVIDETNMQHELTVTYENLTPVVNLKLEQNGIEVANVQQDAGMVSITAIVQDGNGNDAHTLTWDLNNLGLHAPLGNTLNFSPASLPVSTYEISVIATDNGVGQLSDDAVIRFDVVAPPVVVPPVVVPPVVLPPEVEKPVDVDPKETEEPKSSGGSGGGSNSLWFMLLLLGLASGVRKRHASR